MEIVNSTIEQYLKDIIPPRDAVLVEMEEIARQRNFPIVGPLVGRLLYLLASSMRAMRIMELGSGYGYSAYWFGLAMQSNGRIICTDQSEENRSLAMRFFKRGGIAEKIDFRLGNALDIIGQEREEFDIIFNDVDKEMYPAAFEAALPKLRKGGMLISDNVLWKGQVADGSTDSKTESVRKFNRLIFSTPALFSTIIPLRDGISISTKL